MLRTPDFSAHGTLKRKDFFRTCLNGRSVPPEYPWVNSFKIHQKTQVVKKFFDEQESGADGSDTQTIADEVQADRDDAHDKPENQGKFLLVEFYVVVFDEDGSERVDQIILLGDGDQFLVIGITILL